MAEIHVFDRSVLNLLKNKILELENAFSGDVISYQGPITYGGDTTFRDEIETLQRSRDENRKRLVVLLTTPGGEAQAVERMVFVTRQFYEEVYFVVPEYAYSAGTLFCMSGEKIFMDYFSSLGPVDPQVLADNQLVPALGYLDKVNEMIEKSMEAPLSSAEFAMLQKQDLGMLRSYEQARDLTVSLLKEWLVNYKFKDWTHHRTDPDLLGQPVTLEQKQVRAEQIARDLGDHQRWHSHGRSINIQKLRSLRLEIEDYTDNKDLMKLIRDFSGISNGYSSRFQSPIFVFTRSTVSNL